MANSERPYFRYVAGNIVDVSTLTRTLAELKASGVDTRAVLLDAGYYGEDNVRELCSQKITFVTRLKKNLKLYKTLVQEYLPTLASEEHLTEYNARYAYIRKVPCTLVDGYNGYAYVCLDIEGKNAQTNRLFKRAKVQKLGKAEVFQAMASQGVFVLVSSKDIQPDQILPTYYTRQQIEQIFDIGKNYAEMIPLRVQSEETLRGHLLLTFVASVILKRIQDKLQKTPYQPQSLFLNLRNQKCKVYENTVITGEPQKKANDGYKLFGITRPVEIPVNRG